MKTKKMLAILVLALGLTTEVANADFTFGTPIPVPNVNSSAVDVFSSISADGLSLFFGSTRSGGYGSTDIWVAARPTTNDDWGEPINLGPTVNSSSIDNGPSISVDGLSLFFYSKKPGGYGERDIYVATRETTDEPFSAAVNLGPTVNSSADEMCPSISADGLQLYFSEWEVFRPGGYGNSDMWVTTRATASDPWGTPVNLGPTVNSSAHDDGPFITADGLTLFFNSTRPGSYGINDIFVTRRATTDDDWDTPVNLWPTVSSSYGENIPRISADGSTLYFNSDRPGGYGGHDLWQAPILPVVDLNGDGIVDCADMCMMVEHWGEYYPLCDIGPTPLGDGIVDVQDLIVLAEHLFTYPGAVAYWKLDETEGDIASDSANDNDGTVYGDPAWQPEGGMVNGALQLDGINDYVSTGFVLNPEDGPFSVLAWVKGGVPGQAVLSQAGGVNWLMCTPAREDTDGKLMTDLQAPGGDPLRSQTVITDGDWHRIALVWDGSHRTLYVDDIAVAEDEQTNLEGSNNGLYIGTGKAMEAGTYWSGLIDDVRIYGRAISP